MRLMINWFDSSIIKQRLKPEWFSNEHLFEEFIFLSCVWYLHIILFIIFNYEQLLKLYDAEDEIVIPSKDCPFPK